MQPFTEKKIRIAIILAGQLRQWDIASKIFAMYNDIHPDVQYDFFLSTWDDTYMEQKAIETNFLFLNEYEVISPSVIKKRNEDYVKYPYLLKRVNQLKNDYQSKNDIKYDCVISTRPDILLSLKLLHSVNIIINNTKYKQVTPNTIYTCGFMYEVANSAKENASNVYIEASTDRRNMGQFAMNDLYVIGHENAINIHANLYDDMYVKKIQPNLGPHQTSATHIINNKLNSHNITGTARIIRYTHLEYLNDVYKTGKLKNLYNLKNDEDINDEFDCNFKELAAKYDPAISQSAQKRPLIN
jgi:hypothetical protein